MSDGEGFLTRWSRRKRETARADPPQAAAAPQADQANASPDASGKEECAAAPETQHEGVGAPEISEFDPASLPPLESIGPESDITAFLAKNVPAALKHAALRRVWASDPAIRDFVGLQENDWDFTKPDGIPGFGGAIAEHDVKEMVQRIFGEGARAEAAQEAAQQQAGMPPEATAEPEPVRLPDAAQPSEANEASGERPLGQDHESEDQESETGKTPKGEVVQAERDAALQNHPAHSPGQYRVRPRGGAMPRVIGKSRRDP